MDIDDRLRKRDFEAERKDLIAALAALGSHKKRCKRTHPTRDSRIAMQKASRKRNRR